MLSSILLFPFLLGRKILCIDGETLKTNQFLLFEYYILDRSFMFQSYSYRQFQGGTLWET